jgi:predicted DCC family thiol-disulfide oxidoreductase YuxK
VRRFLKDLATYVAELTTAALKGWNAFFFAPADPTMLGLIRIAAGLLAFWSMLVLGLDLHDYFGSTGWAEPSAIRALERPLSWSFWFLVPDAWLRPVWLGCLVILILFVLGLYSRVTAVLGWAIVVSTVHRLPIALFGFDQILSALLLYLAVTGASGQAVSLDRFLRRWRQARARAAISRSGRHKDGPRPPIGPEEPGVPVPTVSANLALRLVQIHVVLIYAMAGLAKLQGPSWWTGLALWKTMTTGEFVGLDFTATAAWPLLVNLLTHASLLLELVYPVLIWVKILRPLMLAGVALLHLGIAVTSPGLAEFALVMLASNLAFVSGAWLRGLVTGPDQPLLTVVYDGACPRCRASMALVLSADPDHVIDPVDLTAVDVRTIHPSLTGEACMQTMHVVTTQGIVAVGFDAVRAIAAKLPAFWMVALVGSIPGVAWAGRSLYNRIAVTRPRDVACTDDVCGLSSRTPLGSPRDRGQVHHHHRLIAPQSDPEEMARP